jgi:hypothetical protein
MSTLNQGRGFNQRPAPSKTQSPTAAFFPESAIAARFANLAGPGEFSFAPILVSDRLLEVALFLTDTPAMVYASSDGFSAGLAESIITAVNNLQQYASQMVNYTTAQNIAILAAAGTYVAPAPTPPFTLTTVAPYVGGPINSFIPVGLRRFLSSPAFLAADPVTGYTMNVGPNEYGEALFMDIGRGTIPANEWATRLGRFGVFASKLLLPAPMDDEAFLNNLCIYALATGVEQWGTSGPVFDASEVPATVDAIQQVIIPAEEYTRAIFDQGNRVTVDGEPALVVGLWGTGVAP